LTGPEVHIMTSYWSQCPG